jgi:hypothetical protein
MEQTREFSKAVFGNRHRLEVLAAIANGESEFYVQQLVNVTGIPSPTITAIVQELGEDLIRPLPRLALNAPHYYQRVDHPLWRAAADLLDQMARDSRKETRA